VLIKKDVIFFLMKISVETEAFRIKDRFQLKIQTAVIIYIFQGKKGEMQGIKNKYPTVK